MSAGWFEAAGFWLLGALNAGFVAACSRADGMAQRVLHHALDLSHFAVLGVLAAFAQIAARALVARWPMRRNVTLALRFLVFAAVFTWAVREDFANFLERQNVPSWVPARSIAGALVGAGYLVFRELVLSLERRLGRQPMLARSGALALLLSGALTTAANNRVLPSDYPGAHFVLALCSGRLATAVVRLASVPSTVSRRALWVRVGILSIAASAGVVGLVFGTRSSVWRLLFDVPGSVAAPLLSEWASRGDDRSGHWIRTQYPGWFREIERKSPIRRSDMPLVPASPVVIFLTLDALRADVLATPEHDATLPELSRLRDASVWFTNARSPSPSTLTTVMAIFTGKYYSQTYWVASGKSVLPTRDRSPRWPALLGANGVRTAHVLAVKGLSAENGIGVGFQSEVRTSRNYGHAPDVMKLLIAELEKPSPRGAFVYAHFVDSHAPYTLAGNHGTDFERYLREVALVDRELGRLRKFLAISGLERRAVLIVSADHGEAFGEHGMTRHARSVYEELLRVPLLVHYPGVRAQRVAAPVTLLDVGPTVLDFFALDTPAGSMGQTLTPLLRGQTIERRLPILADSGRRIQALIYPDGIKVIRDLKHKTQEIYDLKADPGELRDLTGVPEFPAQRYLDGAAVFFEVTALKRPGWEPPWRKF